MNVFNKLFVLLFFLVLLNICTCVSNNSLLLIISFDGFRNDYINRPFTHTLNKFKVNSSYSSYMQSIFPTKTFPNHFSIATGLYSEVHGVLDNEIFDNSTNSVLHYGFKMFHYIDGIVPIWTLNEKAGEGRHSGCMMWPGSDYKYQGILPFYSMAYNGSVPIHERIDTLLSWFKHPETPINLGLLYYEQPDLICHTYGPNSEQINEQIAHVDEALQYLLNESENAGLLNRLNIIVLSDHGGQAVKVPENNINLTLFLNDSWYSAYGVSPNLQIYPVIGKEAEVLKALKEAREKKGGNFTTYTQAEMPKQWHYNNCDRTPPILITADPGYNFLGKKVYPVISPEIGTHGYDPLVPTMRATFMAAGPMFKKGYEIEPFENINIYPLVAHMLGLNLPELKPNGSLSPLQDILVSQTGTSDESHLYSYLGGVFVICLVAIIIFAAFFKRKSLWKTVNQRASLSSNYNDIL